MVDYDKNFDEVRDAAHEGLADGLEELHGQVLKAVVTNMRDGQDALGNNWEPLAEETIRAKGSDVPLIDNSTMMTNINAASDFNRGSLIGWVGTNLDYPVHHEFGAPEAGIPRRPIFGPAGALAGQLAPDIIGRSLSTRIRDATLD